MISVKREEPVISHSAQLCGHSTPVDGEKVRELLPVERDIKNRAAGSLRLL